MPRADLHYALAVDREIHDASKVDPSLLDPVVRVDGGLPGVARPFRVVRDYQGPVGLYMEHFVLLDGKGRELARSDKQRVRLTGEMFENRFETALSHVELANADEHELAFFIDDAEVGRIPVFIEAGGGGDASVAAEETYKKALQKGTILWLVVPQPDGREHSQPVWFVFDKSSLYVLSGPSEQDVPNLATSEEVEIIARSKDMRSLVSRVPATVRVVEKGSDEWTKVIDTAISKRLNLKSFDEARTRWEAQCTLVELTPRFRSKEAEAAAASAPAAAAAPAAGAGGAGADAAAPGADEPKVEAGEIDQETYDKLIAEGKSERIARAKAKAAYVRKEKQRLRAEAS
jgi:hypothetical protein